MNLPHRLYLLLILLIGLTNVSSAKPFIPVQDNQIIERLPKQLFQPKINNTLKQLRDQLKAHPDDWSTASQLAQRYIELAKTHADPRYMGYAQAVLQPWWQSDQPPTLALIMRAMIRQNSHDFDSAHTDLDQILNRQPGHPQANLIKATIATVQGDYQTAINHCQQLMRRSSMLLAVICQSTPASLSGKAETSYQLLYQLIFLNADISGKDKVWAWTSLAEIAWRLGYFKTADQHFQTALQNNIKDNYLLRVYSDFLLQQLRPVEVIKLLNAETQNDSLLLRLAIANKRINSKQLPEQIALLNERFNANRKRGSSLHKGDEARFKLHLLNRPQAALQLARQNWQVQREPADTYILLQAAIAANDDAIVKDTRHWLSQQDNDDVLIQHILATHTDTDHEI